MVETTIVAGAAHYPGVDWQQCLVLADDNEGLASDLLSMFTDGLPEDAEILAAAFKAKNYSALKDQAHKMHGALCYCAIPTMKDAMCHLEVACLEVLKDSTATAAVESAYVAVEHEIKQLLKYLA